MYMVISYGIRNHCCMHIFTTITRLHESDQFAGVPFSVVTTILCFMTSCLTFIKPIRKYTFECKKLSTCKQSTNKA